MSSGTINSRPHRPAATTPVIRKTNARKLNSDQPIICRRGTTERQSDSRASLSASSMTHAPSTDGRRVCLAVASAFTAVRTASLSSGRCFSTRRAASNAVGERTFQRARNRPAIVVPNSNNKTGEITPELCGRLIASAIAGMNRSNQHNA